MSIYRSSLSLVPKLRAARVPIFVAALVFGALAGVQALRGQASDGNLVGAVVDPSGAAVPGADVQVENTTTGVKSEPIKTNPSGEYRFNNLLAGAYTLTVTKDGFKGVTLQGINV